MFQRFPIILRNSNEPKNVTLPASTKREQISHHLRLLFKVFEYKRSDLHMEIQKQPRQDYLHVSQGHFSLYDFLSPLSQVQGKSQSLRENFCHNLKACILLPLKMTSSPAQCSPLTVWPNIFLLSSAQHHLRHTVFFLKCIYFLIKG